MGAHKPKEQLNPKQAAFLEGVLNGQGKGEAYRAAFGDNLADNVANSAASRLLTNPLVQAALEAQQQIVTAAVDRALAKFAVEADRVAEAMARLAFTDFRDVADWGTEIDPETGKESQWLRVKDPAEITDDAHQAICEVRRNGARILSVRLFNKMDAMMNLAKLKGWIDPEPQDNRQLVMLKIER